MDECLTLIRESVVPSLKEQNGFLGFVALAGRQHPKSIGYSIWADETGLAAGETSGKLSFPAGTLKIESTWGVCDN